MAVFRVERNQNYTVMSNYHLREEARDGRIPGDDPEKHQL